MGDTKARILQEALELFSREGYEAVSVSQIASALDMTKGALYRHYKSKRDIFESILSVMEQRDAQGAAAHQLPESPAAQTPEAYRAAALEQLLTYSKAQFRSWTEDPFAAAFRRMLTLEQYRSAEIRALYQQYLAAGPLGYVEDLLSYVAIGARSVEDQHHRLTVSGFDVPAGMKNPTSGDFSVMLNSVYAAQHPHHFVYRGYEVETTGNELTHVVLRGAVNTRGVCIPNYHYEDMIHLIAMYEKMDLKYPAAIVDSNHSNSNKQYAEQIRIVKEVMHNRQLSEPIHRLVKGVMIESYIEPGSQGVHDHIYGKSITDPCLGWEESEKLIYDIAEMNR